MSLTNNFLIFSPKFVINKDIICPNQILYNGNNPNCEAQNKENINLVGFIQGLNAMVQQMAGQENQSIEEAVISDDYRIQVVYDKETDF